jgi:hypothetical protein
MMRSLGHAAAIAVLLGVSAPVDAQPKNAAPRSGFVPKEPKPTVVRLAVDPAPEPRPALKYSFVRRLSERKPGNAVPFYYRAILGYSGYEARTEPKRGQGLDWLDTQLDEWSRAPLETFPRDEVRKVVEGFRPFDDLLEAANREECNWDWRLQDMDGIKNIEFLLGEIQQSRGLARWLAVKARLEIAEGRYADAVETLRVGYQLARDLGKPPLIISGLVGMAIAGVLDDQVHALIAAPGSPNLYWALTELPCPLVDVRPAIEFEVTIPFRVFPFLKEPETALHSPAQWAELVSRSYYTTTHDLEGSQRQNTYGWQARLAATASALRGYTRAKQELIAAGHDRARIEQMSVGQVIAIHEAYLCRYVADETRKWTLVPYPAGQRKLKQVDSQLVHEGYLGPSISTREIVPMMSILLPATSQASEAMLRRDISIAADRVIEAIRMQASQHGGKLPRSLSEVSVVPVPLHPRFGEPFPYKLEGNTAILEVRRSTEPPEPMQESDYIFEVTIASDRGQTGAKTTK